MTGGRLVVCPTPIGNLEDVTLRVLAALRDADVVACEDTRRTRVLLERYGVQASLVSYHEHNERERAAELVERMLAGEVVALVSDAGMPLVSDPGYVLVQGCVAAGLEVEVLPGPSAALAALVASALPADVWRFAGFLPRKRGALVEVLGSPETVVAFESPRRVGASLAVLAELDPERPVAVCRELTKLHEEVVRGAAAELAERYADDAAARRGRAGDRRCAARARASIRRPSTRCAGSSRRARGRGRPRAWSPSSPGCRRTRLYRRGGGVLEANPPRSRSLNAAVDVRSRSRGLRLLRRRLRRRRVSPRTRRRRLRDHVLREPLAEARHEPEPGVEGEVGAALRR